MRGGLERGGGGEGVDLPVLALMNCAPRATESRGAYAAEQDRAAAKSKAVNMGRKEVKGA